MPLILQATDQSHLTQLLTVDLLRASYESVLIVPHKALYPNNGTREKPLMRPVFCNLQEIGHLISVEF